MKESATIWVRIAIDHVIYIVSLVITFAFLLDAMGKNIVWVFSLLDVDNENLAVSEVLSAIIPLSIVSLLTILFGFLRLLFSIGSAIRTGSLEEVRTTFEPVWQFIVLAFVSCVLVIIVVLQIIDYKNFFQQ